MHVPYCPSAANTASDMIARQLNSSGTRALGRYPVRCTDPRALADLHQGFPQLGGYQLPNIPYQAAKRMKLGALGLTTGQSIQGAKTGAAAAGVATSVGTSVASTIGLSAAAGSVVPVIGTAIGVIVGLLASGIFNRTDQEVQNFDQAVAIWQQNRNAVLDIANKYLVLAGLFDLKLNNPHIPIYLQYGRMGEVNFVRDMVNVIYQAATSGKITASDTPQTIFDRFVQPWINGFGKGTMVDPHADLINLIILGMIAEYVGGQQGRWLARGGDFPFAGLPPFPLQQILQASQPQQAVVGPAPVTVPAIAAPAPVPVLVQTPTPIAAPPPPAAPAAAPTISAPSQLSSADRATITGPTTLGLINAQGHVFQLGAAAPYGFYVYIDGMLNVGQLVTIALANGGNVYGQNSQGNYYQWTNSAWQQLPGPPVINPPATVVTGTTPVPTVPQPVVAPAPAPAVPTFPAGFTAVGADSNGVPVYANASGVLYQWTGTAMQAFTGQLAAGNSSVTAQIQAAIQNALAQGQSQAQATNTAMQAAQSAGVPVTPQLQQQVADQTAATAAAPPQVTAAGGGSLLSGGTGLAVIAGVLGVLFLTARPHHG